MAYKTALMRKAEAKVGMTIEAAFPKLYPKVGLQGVADEFGVSKATAYYWMLRCGYHIGRRLLLRPQP